MDYFQKVDKSMTKRSILKSCVLKFNLIDINIKHKKIIKDLLQ